MQYAEFSMEPPAFCILHSALWDHCNSIHFYPDVSWEPGDLDRRSGGWRVDEVARVHLVHRDEVIHVREKHRRADDVFEAAAGGLEQRADVSHDTIGLTADIAVHDRARCRVDRDLAGDEKKIAGADRG